MKKGLFILSFLCFSGLMMAQEVQMSDTVVLKGVHPWKLEENENGIAPEIAHWSIIPHFGFNAFDGDFTSEMKHNVAIPSLGLALEYNFTPVWTVGIEYMYDQYTVTGRQGIDPNGNPYTNADTLLNGHMHRAGAYLAMDVINLFFPRANKKIVSLIPYIGAGGAWYRRSAYFKDDKRWGFDKNGNEVLFNPTHGRGQTAGYINADGVVGKGDYDTKYNMEGYLQAGVDLDFNLNRTLALGLRANYTYFTRDYFDGRGYHVGEASYASKNNDGIFEITANLRFKLEAVSKSHPRNMPSFDVLDKYNNKPTPIVIPHDTIIIYRHDSIIVREIIKPEPRKEVYNVYFDNDKYNLRQDALVTIQQVADRMEEDTTLYAVVIGYCDNTGANDHNFELGDNRANIVVEELTEEYVIPASHLYGKGSGKLVGHRSKGTYGPNRRAAIHLVDKETFDLMIMELEGKSETRDPSIVPTEENSRPVALPRLVPLEESTRREQVNQYKERQGDTIVSDKNTSLTKLARHYYDNIYCWVYIYLANKDRITSPNAIPNGTELLIPELTEEELHITKEESIALYGLRHLR